MERRRSICFLSKHIFSTRFRLYPVFSTIKPRVIVQHVSLQLITRDSLRLPRHVCVELPLQSFHTCPAALKFSRALSGWTVRVNIKRSLPFQLPYTRSARSSIETMCEKSRSLLWGEGGALTELPLALSCLPFNRPTYCGCFSAQLLGFDGNISDLHVQTGPQPHQFEMNKLFSISGNHSYGRKMVHSIMAFG